MGTLVQVPTPLYQAATATTIAQAFASDVVAGNVIVASIQSYSTTVTVTGVTATAGRNITFTQVGTLLRSTTDTPNPFLTVWIGTVSTSGPCTVTGTYSATVIDRTISIWEISNVAEAGALTNGAVGNNTAAASGNITLSRPGFAIKVTNEFIWTTHNQAAGTPTTGWTEVGDNATGFDSAWQNWTTGPGTVNGEFTLGTTTSWCCRMVAMLDVTEFVFHQAVYRGRERGR